MLAGKHILLGVSGGIAAYKSALLVRELVRAGAEVQVLMTPAAAQFITPLTLGTLSRREVIVEMFPPDPGRGRSWTAHVDLALWADLMLIAPATADTLAAVAHGFAGNFLTATVLALRCPLAVAPSMDVDMYHHPATQANLDILRRRGVLVCEPEEGELASGLSGAGRLPEPAVLAAWLDELLAPEKRDDLRGRRILVTAGPTHEPIDPVRFLGNRSSGKMGFAIARAAARRGARVTLVAGPVHLETPPGVERVDVMTAREMHQAVLKALPSADALIMSAAVADFAPAEPSDRKIKKEEAGGAPFMLELRQNPDILADAARCRTPGQRLIGFALETENGLENARKKLAAKKLDLVVLNNPLEKGAGFGVDTNIVTLLSADGSAATLPQMPKAAVAERVLDALLPLLP